MPAPVPPPLMAPLAVRLPESVYLATKASLLPAAVSEVPLMLADVL
jgi:hypothetical protein